MHPLDIISNSPNLYILRKESNKTNFGGFLFLIYLIIIITIFVYYIIDYTKNDKYIIQSFNHFNIKTKEEKEERNKKDFYNPTINFTLDMQIYFKEEFYYLDYKKFGTNLKIYDNKKQNFIERRTLFSTKINDFHIFILYECDNLNCSDYSEQLKNLRKEFNISSYYLYFEHSGFTLDHQNENKPIIKTDDNKPIVFFRRFNLNFKNSEKIRNKWKNILYTEKKGYFQKDSDDSCGYIESYESFYYDFLKPVTLTEIENKIYLLLSEITFQNDYTEYNEYFRKRVSELDLLANFLSLMVNIFTGVKFIFSFYSTNFDNFKIIEKILNRQAKKNYKINNNIDIEDSLNKKFFSINDDLNEVNIQKDIEKTENNNDSDFHEFEDDDCSDDKSSTDSKRVKKLHFFDFFLNNIYCCLKNKKSQKIIHKCNQIVEKYASIDILIKNQILIENFLKDYKWNDPDLNNVENNKLFKKLKAYL